MTFKYRFPSYFGAGVFFYLQKKRKKNWKNTCIWMLVFQILQKLIIRVGRYICVSLYFTDRITDLIFKIKVFFLRNYYLSTWLTSNKHKMQILLLHSALRLYKKGGFCIRLYLKIFETLFHNYLPCNVKLSLFL